MRVITGTARGRRLKELEGMETRPTTDRVKEGMFSILQFDIEGRRVLDLFAGTGKTIEIDPMTNQLVFRDGDEIIHLYKLSSGEKQLLIILLRVFLMDEQPYILLMDEPEISLHIEWQYRLFEEIQKLNPHCQIITSTHSPSLFGDGWGDKLVFIEDLLIQ